MVSSAVSGSIFNNTFIRDPGQSKDRMWTLQLIQHVLLTQRVRVQVCAFVATFFDSRTELEVFSFQGVQPETPAFCLLYLLSPPLPHLHSASVCLECSLWVTCRLGLRHRWPAYQVLRGMNIQISYLHVPGPAGPSEGDLLYPLCDRWSTGWDHSLRGGTGSGKALGEWWHDSSVFYRR